MKLLLGLLLAAICGFPQTSAELRQKYGPARSEHYEVRPGIILVANYGDSGAACEMRIEPKKSSDAAAFNTMDSEVVTDIIDELVPVTRRGPLVTEVDVNGGCTGYKSAEYELVRINRTTRCQAQGGWNLFRLNPLEKSRVRKRISNEIASTDSPELVALR